MSGAGRTDPRGGAHAAGVDPRDRDQLARAVRAFLRSRRTRFRPTAYQVYATLVVGGIAGALAGNAVSEAIGGSLNARKVLVFGPVLLFLALLAALRFGTWQGPVGFSTPDVSFLLTAPIAIAALVRPKLDQGIWVGAVVGAAAAGVALLVMTGGFGVPRRSGRSLAWQRSRCLGSPRAGWSSPLERRGGSCAARAPPPS